MDSGRSSRRTKLGRDMLGYGRSKGRGNPEKDGGGQEESHAVPGWQEARGGRIGAKSPRLSKSLCLPLGSSKTHGSTKTSAWVRKVGARAPPCWHWLLTVQKDMGSV